MWAFKGSGIDGTRAPTVKGMKSDKEINEVMKATGDKVIYLPRLLLQLPVHNTLQFNVLLTSKENRSVIGHEHFIALERHIVATR